MNATTFRNFFLNCLLLLASLVLVLLLCEGIFYYLNTSSPPTKNPISVVNATPNQERLNHFQYHSVYGIAGLPEVQGEFRKNRVTHNSKGLRGEEIDYKKGDKAKRAIFLGDSQTWGWAVSDDETIPYYFKSIMHNLPTNDYTYETVNLGVTGYGAGQSYLRLISEGLRYEPDYVIFTYFAENDIFDTSATRGYGIEKPYLYEKNTGQLCVSNVPPAKASGWPSDNIDFIMKRMDIAFPTFTLGRFTFDTANTNIAKYFINNNFRSFLVGSWGSDDSDPVAAIDKHIGCLENSPGPTRISHQENMDFVIRLILKMKKTAESEGARFFLVAKPSEQDYLDNRISHEYSYILTQLAANQVEIVEIYGFAKQANLEFDDLYIQWGHLGPEGNKLIASRLVERIHPHEYNQYAGAQ